MMSCIQVADAVASGKYPLVMCNLAPPDMVGHTGVYNAAVTACEATGISHHYIVITILFVLSCYCVTMVVCLLSDEAIGVILKSCETNGYTLLVTSDHGNAETMIDEHGNPVTKHTTNRGEHLQLLCGREIIVMLITIISSIITVRFCYIMYLYGIMIYNGAWYYQ